MLDIVLLRLMKSRKTFNQLYQIVPKDGKVVDPQTVALLKDFEKYYAAYPSHNALDMETFLPRFIAWHPTLKPEQAQMYTQIIKTVFAKDADEDQRRNITSWLAECEMVNAISNIGVLHAEGEIEDAFSAVTEVMDNYRRRTDIRFDNWIDDNIVDLMKEDVDDSGVPWRQASLNSAMRKLRPGDFGILAARPDKGKTSFLADQLTHMARFIPKDQNILWFNNEGLGRRIVPRLYCAALDLNKKELGALGSDAERQYIGVVGRRDRIRVHDIHGFTNGQVEMVIDDNKPAIAVFDMIDKIRGFGSAARTDLALEQMYDWARERCVKYNMIGIATSQISNEGDGLMYPTLGMLKDSKTGKQGACDFQLMMGSSNEQILSTMRYFSLPKNKLTKPDGNKNLRAEMYFNADNSRFHDCEGTLDDDSRSGSESEGMVEAQGPRESEELRTDVQPRSRSGHSDDSTDRGADAGASELDAFLEEATR